MNRKPFPHELRRFFVLAATCIRVSWSLFIFPVPRRKNGRINGHYLVAAAGKLRGTSGHRPFFTLLGGCFDNPLYVVSTAQSVKIFSFTFSNNLFFFLLLPLSLFNPLFPLVSFLTRFFFFRDVFKLS